VTSQALLVLLVQSTAVYASALFACGLAKDNAEIRLLVCRAALVATIVILVGSPWIGRRPSPVIPVSLPRSFAMAGPPISVAPTSKAPASDASTVDSSSSPASKIVASSAVASSLWDWGEAIQVIWLGGVLVLGGVLCAGYFKLIQVRRKTKVAPTGPLVDGIWRACADFQVRPPMVRAGKEVLTPFVASVSVPTLYVPQSWLEGGEPEMLDAICRHEIAHLSGRDLQWQFAQRICTILLWPHPLLWMISRAGTVAGEQVCDLKVLSGGFPAKAYAESLLKLKDGLAFTGGLEPIGIGAVTIRSAFGKRIETIMKSTDILRRELSRPGKLGLIAGSCLITGLAATLIAAPGIKEPAVAGTRPKIHGGFEDGMGSADLGSLTGWNLAVGREGPEYIIPADEKSHFPAGFRFGKDTSVRHNGRPSAAFSEIKLDKVMSYHGIAQMAKADPYRGKRIRLTGFLKTQDATYAGFNI
jgi:beta-lactamase regulating signal transducer with metallopeptidase domain